MQLRRLLAVLIGSCATTWIFAFAPAVKSKQPLSLPSRTIARPSTALYNDNNTNQRGSGVEEGIQKKLVAETIAPWRAVRLFFYFALGSGAAVGGFITLAGTLAALSGSRSDITDMNTEYMNLAIDFGAVAIFGLLAKLDLDKKEELDQRVEERMQEKKSRKELIKSLKEREAYLGTLQLQIQVSSDGATQEANIRNLQLGAKQHIIIIAGPKKACRDALIGANFLKMDFAMSNILVVPYDIETDAMKQQSRPDGTGFGSLPIYERQAYVARPSGEGWDEYIKAEMEDAVKQNGEKVKEEGIAIVVARTGKVIRRGVGKVPWRQMVEQLEESVKT